MNDVFPAVQTVMLADAAPGSILKIPRSGGPVMALVTDQISNDTRSVVFLNARLSDRPPVIFAANWRLTEPCLSYSGNIRFELGMAEDEIDINNRYWWETAGVIVSIGNQLLIRAAPTDFAFSSMLVDIRTGGVFAGAQPNSVWNFGSWTLCLRDDVTDRCLELCSFKALKTQA